MIESAAGIRDSGAKAPPTSMLLRRIPLESLSFNPPQPSSFPSAGGCRSHGCDGRHPAPQTLSKSHGRRAAGQRQFDRGRAVAAGVGHPESVNILARAPERVVTVVTANVTTDALVPAAADMRAAAHAALGLIARVAARGGVIETAAVRAGALVQAAVPQWRW